MTSSLLKKVLMKLNIYIFNNFSVRATGGGRNTIQVKRGGIFMSCKITISGINNTLIVADGGINRVKKLRIFIKGNNNIIKIGSNNSICDMTVFVEDDNNTLTIGNNNRFAGDIELALMEGTQISIADNCLFSSNIKIRTGDSHSLLDNYSRNRINKSKSISINNHVWLGQNVSVLKGVTLFENSVVGMGSLVTKTIDKGNCVIAGVPAKLLKENIDWNYFK